MPTILIVNGAPTVKCPYCGAVYEVTEERMVIGAENNNE